ncbi:hypothetical protein [Roseovarius nanhaiticus]|uniref:Uncharacterized protein n=1 Tax=Roseovarius nanhaiticus TaxID=573024 RepID=A0A1N7HHI3_9RHOB|nr:hypothetical protein [Roseovarius nanhaiticus]SEK94771.1 hypothetical protein SAMN05216208_2274 [Roseovarius nanhaiticus]SIS24138.1 hypothetical protein SAMN05421666_3042 [Roseovarius nanhaiticus]
MSTPRRGTLIAAALASAAILAVSGVAVWHHLGGGGGETPTMRNAVMVPVDAAVEAAQLNASNCASRLAEVTQLTDRAGIDAELDRLETCGSAARRLAEEGYGALDIAAGVTGAPGAAPSPRRAQYLDAAGSLLSVYEIQGDDFDVAYDILDRARRTGAPLGPLASDITSILGNASSDVAAAREEAARARDAYRKRG